MITDHAAIKPYMSLLPPVVVMAVLSTMPLFGVVVNVYIAQVLIFTSLAYSLNFIAGLAGYLDFGHVLFMAAGAYAFALTLSQLSSLPIAGVVFGGLMAALFAFPFGLLTLRFRGLIFALASTVLALAVEDIVTSIPQLGQGGGLFFSLPFHPMELYYTVWCLVLVQIVLTWWFKRGRLGYALKTMSSDESVAKAIGIGTTRLKVSILVVSELFAGMSGAVFTWSTLGVHPDIVLNLSYSLEMLAIILIGGMGTTFGPLIGSGILFLIYDYFIASFTGSELIFEGLAVAVVAIAFPGGIIGEVKKRFERLGEVID